MRRLHRIAQLSPRRPHLPSRILPPYAFSNFATASHPQTKVENLISDAIKATGPISFSEYMSLCLSHPTEGYYTKPLNDILGARGDFVTSPEISQVFGELVGICLLSQWLARRQSCPLRIVELGPGTGALMDDLLRVFSQFEAAKQAIREIHLVESSWTLRVMQDEKLDSIVKANEWKIFWHGSIDDVPQDDTLHTLLVAHEFFDALPFYLIEKTHKGWQEVKIALTPELSTPTVLQPSDVVSIFPTRTKTQTTVTPVPSRFQRVLTPEPTATSLLLGHSSHRFRSLPIGTCIEVSSASFKHARKIAELLAADAERGRLGGSALIIDYGDEHAFGDSFRAFKNHKIVDVFHCPGDCDLTANVDFAYLKEAMSDLVFTHGVISQADFLNRMGIDLRVGMLKKSASSGARKDDIEKAAKRLVDLNGMGSQYKVLGITSGTKRAEGVWPFVDS